MHGDPMKDAEWDVQRLRLQLDEKCSSFNIVNTARAEGLYPLLQFFTVTHDEGKVPEGMVLPSDNEGVMIAVDFSVENIPILNYESTPEFVGFDFTYADGTNIRLPICTLFAMDVFESPEMMNEYMESENPDEVEVLYGIEYDDFSTWDGPQDYRKMKMEDCIAALESDYASHDEEVTINLSSNSTPESEVIFESEDLEEVVKNASYLSACNGVMN